MRKTLCVLSALIVFAILSCDAQNDTLAPDLDKIPTKLYSKIARSSAGFNKQITNQSEQYLTRLEKIENRIYGKISAKDSNAAKTIFTGFSEKYADLTAKISSNTSNHSAFPLQEYVPGLDSTQAAIRFISKQTNTVSEFSADKLKALSSADLQLQVLQQKLQSANEIDQFIKTREQQLKNVVANYGVGKEISEMNREAFYYQQQLAEYKNALKDPDKLEEKLLTSLNQVPGFQKFLEKNSYLGQLFGLPDNYSSLTTLDGLQTRALVEKLVSANIGTQGSGGGSDPEQMAQQQMQQAKSMISQLKDKLKSLGNLGGSGDLSMPDGFSKNDQKTKTFLKRIQYGFDVQAERSTNLLPASTAFAGLIGYKLNDKTSIGVGISYRLGMGSGFNHIRLSNQGIGIRSYIDAKIKGSIYFSGGLEYNYLQEFKSIQSIANIDIWQKSALFGLTKETKIGKNKTSKVQILFDALYYQHVPQSSPIVFRIGYQF